MISRHFILCVVSILIVCNDASALTDDEIKAFTARVHVERNTGTQGSVSVQPKGDSLLLISNGVPDHHTDQFGRQGQGPNDLQIQTNSWRIPRYPTSGATTTCLPQGPIGMAINGVALFNPYTRTCCDAGAEELDLFDICMGHPSPSGTYHYHLSPKCLHEIICDKPSTILGVAFDGFPVYGPIDEDGRQLTKKDLDECNGKVTNGKYRYHIINEFPYIMGCYNGTLRGDSGARVTRNCQCRSPTVPCLEFRRRRFRRQSDKPFPCVTQHLAGSDQSNAGTAETGQTPPNTNTRQIDEIPPPVANVNNQQPEYPTNRISNTPTRGSSTLRFPSGNRPYPPPHFPRPGFAPRFPRPGFAPRHPPPRRHG